MRTELEITKGDWTSIHLIPFDEMESIQCEFDDIIPEAVCITEYALYIDRLLFVIQYFFFSILPGNVIFPLLKGFHRYIIGIGNILY